MRDHNYFVYLMTNFNKTVLYVGVTNDLGIRIEQHKS
ncbi:GIY-YIG nuclease family protein [Pedobacter frigiditerrae]|nr:GIY-YIG nuclease family protein [Pedobacter frigiditerrae]